MKHNLEWTKEVLEKTAVSLLREYECRDQDCEMILTNLITWLDVYDRPLNKFEVGGIRQFAEGFKKDSEHAKRVQDLVCDVYFYLTKGVTL